MWRAEPAGEDQARVLQNCARAILSGQPPLAPATEGTNSVRLTSAILLSGWLAHEVPFYFDEILFLPGLNARNRAEGKHSERS